MSVPLKIAIHTPTQKVIHTDIAENGDNCNCICPECKQSLTNKNKGEKRTHHFSHKADTNCNGGSLETWLHKLAKQIIVENNVITVSQTERLVYADARDETKFGDIQPDVTVTSNGKTVYFEILVFNEKKEETKQKYRASRSRCIEIDLREKLEATYEEVEHAVLFDCTNKTEIGWVYVAPEVKEKSFWDLLIIVGKWLLAIVAIFMLLEFVEWLFTPPKRVRR